MQDTVIIVEEVNLPHPRCPRCDMMLPWEVLNGHLPNTAQCKNGTEWKRNRMAAEEIGESTEKNFQEYGCPLNSVL